MSDASSEAVAPEQGRPKRSHPVMRLARAMISAQSYGLVLLLVLITYSASVLVVSDSKQYSIVLALQIVTVWLALRTAKARRAARTISDVLLIAVALFAVANMFASRTDTLLAIAYIGSCFLYFLAPFAILRDLVFRQVVDQETVLGAIAAYLLVGMFFAFVYRLVGVVQSGPFFGAQGDGDLSNCLFFSFVTLTTTGYGNLVPAANPGQSLAVLEALAGQLFLVTAVAKIINSWKPKRWSPNQAEAEAGPGTAAEGASG
jgi:hypothetical protein